MEKRTASLLVVDDEEHIRLAIAEALELEGFQVDTAASGAKALELLAQGGYDLMILDIRMPEVDGVEVMTRLHEHDPNLQVIVLTGFASLESAITAVKTGAVDYLEKPVSNYEIVEHVKTALEKRAGRGLKRQAGLPSNGPVLAAETTTTILAVSPLVLIVDERRVRLSDDWTKNVQLTPVETGILFNLMQHPDQLQTFVQLAARTWDQPLSTDEAQLLLRPHISRLRRKLRKFLPDHEVIQTVRMQGYRYVPNLVRK